MSSFATSVHHFETGDVERNATDERGPSESIRILSMGATAIKKHCFLVLSIDGAARQKHFVSKSLARSGIE